MEYTPSLTINRFLQSSAFIKYIQGPLGGGKSVGCVMNILKEAHMQRPGSDGVRRSRIAIIRNTRQQLMDTTFKTLIDWVKPGIHGTWMPSSSTFLYKAGDVVCELLFRPLDTAEDVKRLLSLELTGAWINEAREIPEDVLLMLKGRVSRYPSVNDGGCTHPFIIMDSNPPNVESWLWEFCEVRKPDNAECFFQPPALVPGTLMVNPQADNLDHLAPDYYPNQVDGATDLFIKVHLRNEYGPSLSGTPVYKDTFKRSFHVAKEDLIPIQSDYYPILVGMDFGLTPAAVIGQQDHRGRVLIFDEISTANEGLKMGLERFMSTKLVPLLQNRYAGFSIIIVGDPAGTAGAQTTEETCFQVIKRFGFKGIPASTNDIEKRISAVENLLAQQVDGEATYLISPRCKHLISGFEYGYIYRVKAKGGEEDKPDKASPYSHIHDANQYLSLQVGGLMRGKTFGMSRIRNYSTLEPAFSSAAWT